MYTKIYPMNSLPWDQLLFSLLYHNPFHAICHVSVKVLYQMQFQFPKWCTFMSSVRDFWLQFNHFSLAKKSKGTGISLGGHFFAPGQYFALPSTQATNIGAN